MGNFHTEVLYKVNFDFFFTVIMMIFYLNSTGSLTTAAHEFDASLNSNMETKQLQNALGEPVLNLVQTAQKRSAAELAETDFPPAKKTLSTVVESNFESPCKVRR